MRRIAVLISIGALALLAVVLNVPRTFSGFVGAIPISPPRATPSPVPTARISALSTPSATPAASLAGPEGHSGLKEKAPAGAAAVVASSTVVPASRALEKSKLGPGSPAPKAPRVAVELPRRITIPSMGTDAGFEYVGLTAEGAMEAPKDPAKVAWYSLGPRPGEPGNAVIAGHVDWGGKPAVFWLLDELAPGDAVEIEAADGRQYEFVVQSRQWYDAATAPVAEVFAQSDTPEVTLITCGGVFDRQTKQYLSRLVVRATLR